MTARAAVLVMEAPQDGQQLEELLGAGPANELRVSLRNRAAALAESVTGGAARVAPPEAALSQAVSRVYEDMPDAAPLLVVWPELVPLEERHAAGALEDLLSGADVVFGPVIDGGLYLLGLSRPLPDLLVALEGADPAMPGLAAASDMGLDIGLLRVERGLRTASDVEAALADPLTADGVRRSLSGASGPE